MRVSHPMTPPMLDLMRVPPAISRIIGSSPPPMNTLGISNQDWWNIGSYPEACRSYANSVDLCENELESDE